jgi:uncharacterized membrane protein (Fun14 family)
MLLFMLTITGLLGIALMGYAVKNEMRPLELVLGAVIVLMTAYLTNHV